MTKKNSIIKAIIPFFVFFLIFPALIYSQSRCSEDSEESAEKRKEIIPLQINLEPNLIDEKDEPDRKGDGLSHRLWEETKTSFTGWRLLGLTAGLAATGIAYSKDEEVRNWFLEEHPLRDASKYGDVIGQGYTHVAIDLGFFAFGKMLHNEKAIETSKALAEGLIINAVATHLLKYTVRRKRPGGESLNSFPSAHTSGAFLTATVISGMYDWRLEIMLPCYLLAAFVGVSRLEDDYHWTSDVVFGATLGTVIGIAVSSYHSKRLENLTIAPMAGLYNGISVKYSW